MKAVGRCITSSSSGGARFYDCFMKKGVRVVVVQYMMPNLYAVRKLRDGTYNDVIDRVASTTW